MLRFGGIFRQAAILAAIGMGATAAAVAASDPDPQTKQTMQDWTAADATCRTTLAQEACQRRADTWNWLFQRGWRRDAQGQWFQLQGSQDPMPGMIGRPQFRR